MEDQQQAAEAELAVLPNRMTQIYLQAEHKSSVATHSFPDLFERTVSEAIDSKHYTMIRKPASNLHRREISYAIDGVVNVIFRLVEHPLPRMTPNTMTNVETVIERLKPARREGFVVSYQENVTGLRVIAAPITDEDRFAAAAI